ncbi:tannase and feruloyl esterase [Sanghuangporus baumii]|uniref:Carboxylic ester hydrolase n=1 Tax=Sanghuangporus baumii TaxID=108892 RepID=A0A9Q5I3D2_SANBA|nr:tannase and feruloyl esterase [Sanghuangporus baumii]
MSFLRQAASKWRFLAPALSLLAPSQYEIDPAAACNALREIDLSSISAIILNATYYENATEVETLGVCTPIAQISEPLCRVQFVVNTSSVSAVTAEAWLPTSWSGRFLALGNGGLGGCIDYINLDYGSSLEFASIASNNGHDGNSGVLFANNSEILEDFTSRAIHVETAVGKELVAAYYERRPRRSYYMGCSTGGRQGMYAALHYPSDFDGVLAGAPVTNFNHLMGWSGMITKYLGAPHGDKSANFIPSHLWDLVSEEIFRQCDGLDGVIDGIITEPDACDFVPETLLCEGRSNENCLSKVQVEALRKVYSPLYGLGGDHLFPRFDPGAENASFGKWALFSGKPFAYTEDWMKYVVLNDSSYDFSQFGLADVARMQAIDPENISTFDGDLSAFRARGGKIITYHGRADNLVPSGNAKSLYNLISRTLGLQPSTLDEFYRLFLVPGMEHCIGGKGAVNFGQRKSIGSSRLQHIDEKQTKLKESSQENFQVPGTQPSNVLLSLVDWVENGRAPDTIIGISDDGKTTREHCRYPWKSQWDGNRWMCAKEAIGAQTGQSLHSD